MILTFPYQEQRGIDPSPATPDQPVFRPKIPLRILGPRGDHFVGLALVDTGADETVLPLAAAKTVRAKLDSKVHALYGADDRPIQVRYGIVTLTIGQPGVGEYTWNAKVGFQDRRRYSVLGRAGGLDLFDVRFDGPNRLVIITTPELGSVPKGQGSSSTSADLAERWEAIGNPNPNFLLIRLMKAMVRGLRLQGVSDGTSRTH